jgi:hypothetical protein
MTTKEQKKDLILKKNYLRFLNKLHKEQLKLQLFDVNKMTEQQIKRVFSYYFVSKDDYFVLRNPNTILQIDNDIFKKMNEPKIRKPREKKPKKEIKFLDEGQPKEELTKEEQQEEEPLTQDITEEEEKIQPSFKQPEKTFRSKYGVSKVQPPKEKIREEIKTTKEQIKLLIDKVKQLEEGSNQEDVITTYNKLVNKVLEVHSHLPESKFESMFDKRYKEIQDKEEKKRRDKRKSSEEIKKELLEGELNEEYNKMLKETKKLELEKEKEKEKLFDYLKTLSNFEIEEIKTYIKNNFKSLYRGEKDLLKEFLDQNKPFEKVEEKEPEKYEPPKKKIAVSPIVEEEKQVRQPHIEAMLEERKKQSKIEYEKELERQPILKKIIEKQEELEKEHAKQYIITIPNKQLLSFLAKSGVRYEKSFREKHNKNFSQLHLYLDFNVLKDRLTQFPVKIKISYEVYYSTLELVFDDAFQSTIRNKDFIDLLLNAEPVKNPIGEIKPAEVLEETLPKKERLKREKLKKEKETVEEDKTAIQIKDLKDKKEKLIKYMNDKTTEEIKLKETGGKPLTKQHQQTIIAGLNKSYFKQIIKTIDEIDLTLKELEKKEGSGKKYVKKIFKK